MRVTFVSPSFYPAIFYGGPIISAYALCQELARQKVELLVATTDANGKESLAEPKNRRVELSPGLAVKYYREQIRNKFSLSFLLNIASDLRHANVVHLQSVFSKHTALGLFWAKRLGKPVVLSPRGSLGAWSLAQGNRMKRIFLRWFVTPFLSNVIFHASSSKEAEEIALIYPQSQVKIIPEGIDLEEFEDSKTDWTSAGYLQKFTGQAFEKPPKIVVALARLHKVKGLDILMEAIYLLLQKGQDVVLLIAGPDGGELENLKEKVIELKLENAVFFTGPLDGTDKVEFLHGADVFALPSHHENFGIAYLEALASGIPIVASDSTPWQSAEEAGCGRWVAATPEAFAEAIETLLKVKNGEFYKKTRAFASRFSWPEIAKQFIQLYEMSRISRH